MTREYARVRLSIWADSDFRLLSDAAQALYFRLLSSPTMNLCGVADWRPNRLAALTAEMTAERVQEVAAELADRGYVVTDEETEEILIRSFVRHDGLIKTPNIAAAMAKDYAGVASRTLRGVIVHELHRLHDEDPGMKGWATASKLLTEHRIDPSEIPSGMASVNPSGMASSTALPNGSGNGSHIPQPTSLSPQPSSTKIIGTPKKPRKDNSTRIPDDWTPTEKHADYCREHDLSLAVQVAKFRNNAEAKDVRFSNWNAAFSNWLINALKWDGPGVGQRPLQPVPAYKPGPTITPEELDEIDRRNGRLR